MGIDYVSCKSPDDALNELDNGNLKAVVYDYPLLEYIIGHKKFRNKLEVISSGVSPVYYAFSSKNIILLHNLDPLIIQLIGTAKWNEILSKYKINHL